MSSSNLLFLSHILDSLRKVSTYLEGQSYSQFLADEIRQDAVIRKLEVVGEATKRVENQLRDRYSEVPWRAMAGMRDKLIHDYFNVDLEIVWETAKSEVPALVKQIELICKELEEKN